MKLLIGALNLIAAPQIWPGSSARPGPALVASDFAAALRAPVDIWWGNTIGRVLTMTTDDD